MSSFHAGKYILSTPCYQQQIIRFPQYPIGKGHLSLGQSLPMALTVVLSGEALDMDSLGETIMEEAKAGVQEFVISVDDDEDEDL